LGGKNTNQSLFPFLPYDCCTNYARAHDDCWFSMYTIIILCALEFDTYNITWDEIKFILMVSFFRPITRSNTDTGVVFDCYYSNNLLLKYVGNAVTSIIVIDRITDIKAIIFVLLRRCWQKLCTICRGHQFCIRSSMVFLFYIKQQWIFWNCSWAFINI